MMTAMGQGQTQVSPYHVTLITAAIANGGTLMKPYLVDRIENHTGSQIDKNLPEKYVKESKRDAAMTDLMYSNNHFRYDIYKNHF